MSWQTATTRFVSICNDIDITFRVADAEFISVTANILAWGLLSSIRRMRSWNPTSSISCSSTYIKKVDVQVRLKRKPSTWRDAQTPAPDSQAVARAVSQVARTDGWEDRLCPVKPPAETPSSLSSPHGAVTPDRTLNPSCHGAGLITFWTMGVSIRVLSGKRNSLTGLDSFQDDPRSAPDPKLLRPVTPPDRIG
ncbi:uncharacterized protein BO88DRAFT_440247 [Aspergillus vadensis CBS 113365]|uniref:Uncharacterized protein n=1 Tax=Aspergillus vadensis (strain CBS 113365 / IMI 142717 / IBT 24658) TaxID=1448311 RepID=A0A319BR29_ASPVC|nr:hypothetical protein BO88DRAFT_440247 [Aspergillus vadensis CBS 113365]PYH74914.1 hypothetical protein BO88DRAFT_440247 [Aspergillus vadensis CBS 113365]